jgi:hypothetical protein
MAPRCSLGVSLFSKACFYSVVRVILLRAHAKLSPSNYLLRAPSFNFTTKTPRSMVLIVMNPLLKSP